MASSVCTLPGKMCLVAALLALLAPSCLVWVAGSYQTPGGLMNDIFKNILRAPSLDMTKLKEVKTQELLPHLGATLRGVLRNPKPGAQILELSYAIPHKLIAACADALDPKTPLPSDQTWLQAAGGLPKWLTDIQSDLELLSKQVNLDSSSFPVTRRAIMGMLLSVGDSFKANVPWSHDDEDALYDIMSVLYKLHWQGMTARGILEHIHVSKAAGSTICLLGSLNSCSTKVFGSFNGKGNCLVSEFEDLPRWISLQAHLNIGFPAKPRYPFVQFGNVRGVVANCSARAAVMKQQDWNFYSNEYTLLTMPTGASLDMGGLGARVDQSAGAEHNAALAESAGLCSEMAYLMVFRHPFIRLISHVKFVIAEYIKMYQRKSANMSVIKVFGGLSASVWKKLMPASTDNYFIRTLLGERIFNLPTGNIKEEHLRQAEGQLLSVDVILDPALVWVYYNLHTGLGWEAGLNSAFAKSQPSNNLVTKALATNSLPHLRSIVNDNMLDVDLYHFSILLGTLDASLFAFIDASGQAIKLSTKSCGYMGLLEIAKHGNISAVLDEGKKNRGADASKVVERAQKPKSEIVAEGKAVQKMLDKLGTRQSEHILQSEPHLLHEYAKKIASKLKPEETMRLETS